MQRPSNVKVWGHDYPIKNVADPHLYGVSVWGAFHPAEQKIVLTKKFKSKTKEADTLLHEIIHCLNYNSNMLGMIKGYDGDKRDLDEHITDTLANGLIMVFRDNPNILDYIKYLLHGDKDAGTADTTKPQQ